MQNDLTDDELDALMASSPAAAFGRSVIAGVVAAGVIVVLQQGGELTVLGGVLLAVLSLGAAAMVVGRLRCRWNLAGRFAGVFAVAAMVAVYLLDLWARPNSSDALRIVITVLVALVGVAGIVQLVCGRPRSSDDDLLEEKLRQTARWFGIASNPEIERLSVALDEMAKRLDLIGTTPSAQVAEAEPLTTMEWWKSRPWRH